jgi:uncharacterized phage protein gp47/JayE
MLARLSSSNYPALAALKTRDEDDFTIAFLDATSVVLDILTFYQERIANENYLRTAGQLSSLVGLTQLIGYTPAPGVAASTYLAFTLRATPGLPLNPSAPPITIPQGTNVQSVPAQGQTPQTFETSADIAAKLDWNAMAVETDQPWLPTQGNFVYLAGTATQLSAGDLLLIVGDERAEAATDADFTVWVFAIVSTVTIDGANSRTLVTWSQTLSPPTNTVPAQNPLVYAFRQRASLFGFNAMNPGFLTATQQGNFTNISNSGTSASGDLEPPFEWVFGDSPSGATFLDLDATYPKIYPGSWIALYDAAGALHTSPTPALALYRALSVSTVSRSDYGMSARITEVATDAGTTQFGEPAMLADFCADTRWTTAHVQSELLPVIPQPLTYPLYGSSFALEALRLDLSGVQYIALSGRRQKIVVLHTASAPTFTSYDGTQQKVPLTVGEVLTLTDPKSLPILSGATSAATWAAGTPTIGVEDGFGRAGTVTGMSDFTCFALVPSSPSDPVVSEAALVNTIDSTQSTGGTTPSTGTVFNLTASLKYVYERATTTVNANVGPATNGQEVTEIMGSGSAAMQNQRFKLKQKPLTYVPAGNARGCVDTLQVTANGVVWSEVPSLYNQPSTAAVYRVMNNSDQSATVVFGDGVEGATLPTGQNNIQASYRIGLGSGGNLAAGALTTLIDRPLGVNGVTNPSPATGGQDPQSIDDIRTDAPQSVLTLGRAVSVTDYTNFAANYPGISQALAVWVPGSQGHGILVTVAGINGAAILPTDATYLNLAASFANVGNPSVPVSITSYVETLFSFTATVMYANPYDATAVAAVKALILQALQQAFGFAARSFGQPVTMDAVTAVIQGVPGVIATNVGTLVRGDSSTAGDLANMLGPTNPTALAAWQSSAPSPAPPTSSDTSGTTLYAYASQAITSPQGTPLPPTAAEILVIDPTPGMVQLVPMT